MRISSLRGRCRFPSGDRSWAVDHGASIRSSPSASTRARRGGVATEIRSERRLRSPFRHSKVYRLPREHPAIAATGGSAMVSQFRLTRRHVLGVTAALGGLALSGRIARGQNSPRIEKLAPELDEIIPHQT